MLKGIRHLDCDATQAGVSLTRRIRRLSSSATTKVSAAPFPNSNTAENGNVGAADFLEMATYGN